VGSRLQPVQRLDLSRCSINPLTQPRVSRYSPHIDIEHIYRVTVHGRFRDLSERALAHLERHRAEHDRFSSAFTPEGTFVYDETIRFFSLRYEVRTTEGSSAAASSGLDEATQFLSTMGFTHHELKASVMDTSAMWDG